MEFSEWLAGGWPATALKYSTAASGGPQPPIWKGQEAPGPASSHGRGRAETRESFRFPPSP